MWEDFQNTKKHKEKTQAHTHGTGKWGTARDWRLLADVRRQLQVPSLLSANALFTFVALIIPFEDVIEEVFERRKLKYADW